MNDDWSILVCFSAVFWVGVILVWLRKRPKYIAPKSSSRPAQSSQQPSQSFSSGPSEEQLARWGKQQEAIEAAEERWSREYDEKQEEKARKDEEAYDRYQEQQEDNRRKQEEDDYYDYLDKKKKWEEDN